MSMFSLVSCGTTKVTYEQGFPTQESPALTNLMGHYFFEKDNLLNSSEERYVYAEENGSYEDKEISYFQYTTDQLKQYYQPMLKTDEPHETFHKLFTDSDELQDNKKTKYPYNLPKLTKKKGNKLSIKTADAEEDISLASETRQIEKEDKIRYNLISANEEGFALRLKDYETKGKYYLFASQDLSDIAVYEESELTKAVEKGELEPFYPLLMDAGDSYKKLKRRRFIDTETNEVKK